MLKDILELRGVKILNRDVLTRIKGRGGDLCSDPHSFYCEVPNHVCCGGMCVLPSHPACAAP